MHYGKNSSESASDKMDMLSMEEAVGGDKDGSVKRESM